MTSRLERDTKSLRIIKGKEAGWNIALNTAEPGGFIYLMRSEDLRNWRPLMQVLHVKQRSISKTSSELANPIVLFQRHGDLRRIRNAQHRVEARHDCVDIVRRPVTGGEIVRTAHVALGRQRLMLLFQRYYGGRPINRPSS
jgi:hypothetical protein